jgi:hypothetical protein
VWPNGTAIPNETTSTSPTPCVFNGTLYLFWSTNDTYKRIIYATFDPSTSTWSANRTINSSDQADDKVAACVFNNQLYLFWRNNAFGTILGTSSANNSWPIASSTNNQPAATAPAACVYDNTLYVFYAEANAVMYTKSSDGRTWTSAVQTNGGDPVALPPAVDVYDDKLYIFTTNTAKQLCVTAAKV